MALLVNVPKGIETNTTTSIQKLFQENEKDKHYKLPQGISIMLTTKLYSA